MKKVLVPLAEGFEEIEAVAVIDILRRARGIEVTVAGVPNKVVKGSRGVTIHADSTIASAADKEYDLLVLPGGMPGTKNLADSQEVGRIIKKHASAGLLLAAICAAPTILEERGILNGGKATCHFSVKDRIKTCSLVDERVVRDRNIITSQGPGTAVEFGLTLVEVLVGREESEKISTAIHNAMPF